MKTEAEETARMYRRVFGLPEPPPVRRDRPAGRVRSTWARLRQRVARHLTRGVHTQPRNGVMIVDDWSNVLMGCCDCGLAHRFDFRIDARGRLVIKGRRDHLATRVIREAQTFTHRQIHDA